ncbi:MAG TPA: glutamate--tRNA ligase [bacterium]|nr:glutamate--tRNA ligase [bacterium]HNT64613.1 glutamate--tRNA ligase [bacterium]HOX85491.1 glutamate--tRNA ligase [bacterium]HPG44650.1 glutamate--tRNA ligase [bacterium]HPM97208.1 glutamate--tRNA ligase [bacterium]
MVAVRVRFAPSPTGFVHIGSLRTALYNFLFARQHQGTFILRIEDTDRTRFVEGATENMIRVLDWAGLMPDEGPQQGGPFGPYFQSERTEIYQRFAQQLIEQGHAYLAFDSPAELEEMRNGKLAVSRISTRYNHQIRQSMRNSLAMSAAEVEQLLAAGEPHVVRLKMPAERVFNVDDLVRGQVNFDSREIDDQILLKSDGYPTYHLANVVDDHLMQISHVIRGEEWLSSVPKHLFLYECFGWTPPKMAHLPLIFNPDGSKMSKRDITNLSELPAGKVDPDVESYIRAGFECDAILNAIALLGWNPGEGDDQQVFSLAELISNYSLERVNKSAAIFDLQKLRWLNKEQLKKQPADVLLNRLRPGLEERGWNRKPDSYCLAVIELLQARLGFLHDFFTYGTYFFEDPTEYDDKALKKYWKAQTTNLVLEFVREIDKLDRFFAAEIEEVLRRVAERHQVGGGQIIHPIRLAVSGFSVGPGLFELLELLGKDTVVKRIAKAVEVIPALQQQ